MPCRKGQCWVWGNAKAGVWCDVMVRYGQRAGHKPSCISKAVQKGRQRAYTCGCGCNMDAVQLQCSTLSAQSVRGGSCGRVKPRSRSVRNVAPASRLQRLAAPCTAPTVRRTESERSQRMTPKVSGPSV